MVRIELFILAIFFIWISSCSGLGPDPDPVPQTQVLAINLYPDTVAVGDTVLIDCIIKDSLDKSFKFYWDLSSPIEVDSTIYGNRIKWKAKRTSEIPGSVVNVSTGVRIDKGSNNLVQVIELFDIPVLN